MAGPQRILPGKHGLGDGIWLLCSYLLVQGGSGGQSSYPWEGSALGHLHIQIMLQASSKTVGKEGYW
jgi:hypothetical protein